MFLVCFLVLVSHARYVFLFTQLVSFSASSLHILQITSKQSLLTVSRAFLLSDCIKLFIEQKSLNISTCGQSVSLHTAFKGILVII